MKARRPEESGFTLLEVMAALVIFLTGVVFVLALFASGLAQHRTATQRAMIAQASELVRGRLDLLLLELGEPSGKNAPGAASELPKPQEVPVSEFPGCFYSVERIEADPDEGAAGGVMLTVFIYTLEGGRKKGERFTLFFRPGSDPGALIRRARNEKVASGSPLKSTEESGE